MPVIPATQEAEAPALSQKQLKKKSPQTNKKTKLSQDHVIFLLRELSFVIECWLITLILLKLRFAFAPRSGYLGSQVTV